MGRIKDTYLSVLNRTLNPLALRLARSGRGPFSLIRHRGRRSGRAFEAPVILAEDREAVDALVAELTRDRRGSPSRVHPALVPRTRR